MFPRICLVHYHEIGLKGRNRGMFEKRLLRNIEQLLEGEPIKSVTRISGRLCIVFEEGLGFEEVRDISIQVSRIPGVARVSCGFKTARDLDLFNEAAAVALAEAGIFSTFKVAARRNHTDYPINSMELNKLVGAYLCEAFPEAIVKMKDPDVQVGVEVVQNSAYVYAMSIPGIGGLPVGTGGTVMGLLSAGFDSPVALWKMARRGAVVCAVHFSGRPQTASTSEYLVQDIARILEKTGCIARVYIVAFGDYQREIATLVPPKLRVIMYRRLMFKVAERLSAREQALALVAGESLGQVASQTIENIRATDAAVEMPVFRPLIGSDKQDIMNEAQQLGTYETSSQDAPDCCTLFMPRNPETHASLDIVEKEEEKLPLGTWVDEIIDAVEIHDFKCPGYKPPKKIEK